MRGRKRLYEELVGKKTFALDQRIIAWLKKKPNASKFVNEILWKRYKEEIECDVKIAEKN